MTQANSKVKTTNDKKSRNQKITLVALCLIACLALVFAVLYMNSRGNISKSKAEDIAFGIAAGSCIETARHNSKLNCNELAIYGSQVLDPGLVSKDGVFTYTFEYSAGLYPNEFNTRISLDRKGNVISQD
jgi:hypothetical protein